MAAEENEHRRALIDLFVAKFGEHIPLDSPAGHSSGNIVSAGRSGTFKPLSSTASAPLASDMELDAARFYRSAAERASDAGVRKLLGDLAEAEDKHEHRRRRARNRES